MSGKKPYSFRFLRLSIARGLLAGGGTLLGGLLLLPIAAAQTASAERGSGLAEGCIACHGTDGNATADNFSTLAGQSERYLFEQMQKIRDGERPAPLMVGQLDQMSDQDLRDMAAWYAGNEPIIGQSPQTDISLGRTLYLFGSHSRDIPACAACHGPAGKGFPLAGLPALTGQRRGIIAKSLRDYRSGIRPSEASGAMQDISRRLLDEDIEGLADFIQGLY